MLHVNHSIAGRGGLAATHELYADGHTRRDLADAVHAGRIIRVRQGWYVTPDVHPTLVQSARVGGRLTCLSGAAMHGIWTYPTSSIHVAVKAEACRLRNPHDKTVRLADHTADVRVHWRDEDETGSRFLLDAPACLADVIRCQPAEVAVATAESALFRRVITRSEWLRVAVDAPETRRDGLRDVGLLCESGTESLLRFRLRTHALPIRCQVRIGSVGRVDFLVGSHLVIEVDGAEYHTDPARFESDRRRDAHLSRLGFRVLRFSYRQIIYRWHEVEAAVLAAVARGDHR